MRHMRQWYGRRGLTPSSNSQFSGETIAELPTLPAMAEAERVADAAAIATGKGDSGWECTHKEWG